MICYKCLTRQECDEKQKEIGNLIISLIEKNWLSNYKKNNQPERSKREDINDIACEQNHQGICIAKHTPEDAMRKHTILC